MFIHEMSRDECNEALSRAKFGRLACARENQPYVLPLDFTFDGDSHLYCFATFGQKIEWMRSNPLVCFEIDEVRKHDHWSSVIVFGQYEELPDKPQFESARRRAHEFLQQRVMWWEPAYISQGHADRPHSLTPIFFRLRIESMTGYRANPDVTEKETAHVVEAQQTETQRKSEWMRILKAAFVYFVIVFGAGSLLGPIRILLAVPRLGERLAELLEAPLMLLVIILAANWIVRRFQLPVRSIYRLGTGVIGLALALVFEFGLVLTLRGMTPAEYFAAHDPVAASVYYVMLLLFAVMPLIVMRKGPAPGTKSEL